MAFSDNLPVVDKSRSVGKIAGVIAAIAVGILFLVVIIGAFLPDANATPTPSSTETATATATPTSVLTEGLDTCRLDENLVGHADNRVVEDFKERYMTERSTGKDVKAAVISVAETTSSQDASVLAINAFNVGEHDNASNYGPLRDGDCLSEEGLKVLEKTIAKYHTATITEVQCSTTDLYNSGFDPLTGRFGVSSEKGIKGDATCIRVEFPDGSWFQSLLRCWNITYSAIPPEEEWHVIPTDNDRPEYNTPPAEHGEEVCTQDCGGGHEEEGGCKENCGGTPDDQKHASAGPAEGTGGGGNVNPGPDVYTDPPAQPADTVNLQPAEPELDVAEDLVPDSSPDGPLEEAEPDTTNVGTSCPPGEKTC